MKKGFLLIAVLILFFSSCRKDPYYDPNEIEDYFTGIIYKDCNGEVYRNEKIVLQRWEMGCFGGGMIDSIIDYTDNDGRYFFKIKIPGSQLVYSTTSYWNVLIVPGVNQKFSITKAGEYNLFPNDTIMNGFIHLHFNSHLTENDTFYYKVIPVRDNTYTGNSVEYFFNGPFHDTTINLSPFRIDGVFENNTLEPINADFQWSINKISNYYSTNYGFSNMTHSPCKNSDTLFYNVNIN